MEARDLLSEEQNQSEKKSCLKLIMTALENAEKVKRPPIREMFTDVYDELPPRLQGQYEELLEHLEKYPNEYPIDSYKS